MPERLIDGGEDDGYVCLFPISNEYLIAVQDIAAIFPRGGCLQRGGITAGTGLGQGEAGQFFTGGYLSGEAVPLLFATEDIDRLSGQTGGDKVDGSG